jgi:hypothetical protein
MRLIASIELCVFVNDIGHKNNFGVMPFQAIRIAVGKAIYAKVHATSKERASLIIQQFIPLTNWHSSLRGHSWQRGFLALHTSAPRSSTAQLTDRQCSPRTR